MAHDHHHHDDAGYFTEQLCTVGISALLGLVSVVMYANGQLNWMLNRKLEWTVLAGGITLLVLAAIRGMMIWVAAGHTRAANHDHAHGHDHGHTHDHGEHHHHDHEHAHGHHHHHDHEHEHEHTHAGHDHGHDHDHSFSAVRYIVLLLPVVLFFLGLPNEGFIINGVESLGTIGEAKGPVKDKGFNPELGFLELTGAAYSPERRALYEGSTVRLKGAFQSAGSDRNFSLVRMKITCCAADAIPLPVVIMIDPKSKEHINPASYQGKWVEVTGQVQFRTQTRHGQQEPVTVVLIRPDEDHPLKDLIALVQPDNSPLQ
ncbi:MAG TPA: hypothetical protein VJ739_08965 [Gemmataceae bacterium]|nr:hypothetical protein [Gemmataceae bacterium]